MDFKKTFLNQSFSHGFTLFELLVTIAIVGVLAGLAAPNMQRSINNQDMKRSANDIFAIFQSARSHALNHGDIPITIDTDTFKSMSYSYSSSRSNVEKIVNIENENLIVTRLSGQLSDGLVFSKSGNTNLVGDPLRLKVCVPGSGIMSYEVTLFNFGQSDLKRGDAC